MPINDWSDDILIAELNDEPMFSDEMNALMARLAAADGEVHSVIVDLKGVTFLNSSNIAQLLRLRQTLLNAGQSLRICSARDPVWSMLLITGLDKIFQFTDDVATSLASLHIGDHEGDAG